MFIIKLKTFLKSFFLLKPKALLVYCVIVWHQKPFQVFVLVFVVVFVSLCWSSCLCVGLLCDCVTAKAIPGLLTFSHFCRRRYSWRLTIIRTKATSVTTIEIEKPYSVKLKLPNCTIFFAHCHSLSNCLC